MEKQLWIFPNSDSDSDEKTASATEGRNKHCQENVASNGACWEQDYSCRSLVVIDFWTQSWTMETKMRCKHLMINWTETHSGLE